MESRAPVDSLLPERLSRIAIPIRIEVEIDAPQGKDLNITGTTDLREIVG